MGIFCIEQITEELDFSCGLTGDRALRGNEHGTALGEGRIPGSPECRGSTLGSEAPTVLLSLDHLEKGLQTHTPAFPRQALHFIPPLPSPRNNRLFLLLPIVTTFWDLLAAHVGCNIRNQEIKHVKKYMKDKVV